MKYHLLIAAALLCAGSQSASATSFRFGSGGTASFGHVCEGVNSTDDFASQTINGNRSLNLSTIPAGFFYSLEDSTDPALTTSKKSSMNFTFAGRNLLGLNTGGWGNDGGIFFGWNVNLKLKVTNTVTGHARMIVYHADSNIPLEPSAYFGDGITDETDLQFVELALRTVTCQNDGPELKIMPVCDSATPYYAPLKAKAVINREIIVDDGNSEQMVTDNISLGWEPKDLESSGLPVSGDSFMNMDFTVVLNIEDAHSDWDCDGTANNQMKFLFNDLLNEPTGASAMANYKVQILIGGDVEARCQSAGGETDANLTWSGTSGSFEQGNVTFSSSNAYLNYKP